MIAAAIARRRYKLYCLHQILQPTLANGQRNCRKEREREYG